jgi:type II secretory pathway component PulF
MPFFYYQAFSKTGKKESGVLEASSPQFVREALLLKGLYPVSVILQSNDGGIGIKGLFNKLFQPVLTLKDKLFFTKQLAMLLKSGIALADAINLMIDQSPKYMIPMLSRIRDDLREGGSFANILSMYPRSFPPLYVQLIKAGEASGQMEKVLLRLAIFLEEEDAFNKSVNDAVRGPLIQLAMVAAVSIFLLTFIVPKIADVFKSMGDKPLPAITKFVLALSDALINNYVLVAVGLFSVVAIYKIWSSSQSGQLTLDKFKLKLPVVKYFNRTVAVVQFSQTLGLLLESGVNIAEALEIVVQIVNNQILVEALKKARDNIIKQGRVTEYLQKTGLFSGVDVHLIGTGEQSGALDSMLIQVGKYNQEDLKEFSGQLTALLNPLSMVILAVVVGTIIIAVMAPLTDMSSMAGGS